MAVKLELEKALAQTEADVHILDHALANLTKLSAFLQVHIPKESIDTNEAMPLPSSFVPVEKFPPAEVQLHFSRTTNSAGRKQKNSSSTVSN